MPRKKDPDNVVQLRGTKRNDRVNPHAPTPDPLDKVPAPLPGLDKHGRDQWKHYGAYLVALRVLTDGDLEMLYCFCVASSMLRDAMKMLDDDGYTTENIQGGLKPHPGVSIVNAAMKQIRSFGSELGISPAARSHVHALSKPDAGSDHVNAAHRLLD